MDFGLKGSGASAIIQVIDVQPRVVEASRFIELEAEDDEFESGDGVIGASVLRLTLTFLFTTVTIL
jgi:hypothetical protein